MIYLGLVLFALKRVRRIWDIFTFILRLGSICFPQQGIVRRCLSDWLFVASESSYAIWPLSVLKDVTYGYISCRTFMLTLPED